MFRFVLLAAIILQATPPTAQSACGANRDVPSFMGWTCGQIEAASAEIARRQAFNDQYIGPFIDHFAGPTTLDGLPAAPRKPIPTEKCLRTFPPDQDGGFCEWYGYATKAQADAFEKNRGYRRVTHADGSGDTWAPAKPKRRGPA